MKIVSWVGALAFWLGLAASVPAAEPVGVFAAASTTNAITEIGDKFVAKDLGRIAPSFGASSTLAKQIENGAPAHIFLSADEKWMNYLADKKLIDAASRTNLLGNRMALIAPADSTAEIRIEPGFPLAKLLGDGRLAVGDPDHVPIGLYAKAALEKLGIWTQIEGKLARAESVRSALTFVERGEAPLGIVYTTDAAVAPKVKILAVFPEDTHPPIVYPAALIAGKETAESKAFFEFLKSPEAKTVFTKYGFKTE